MDDALVQDDGRHCFVRGRIGPMLVRPSTDCGPEGTQRCDVLRTMRYVWESVVAHSLDHVGTESRDETGQSHGACVHREATG